MQKAFAVTVSRAVTAVEPWSTTALKGTTSRDTTRRAPLRRTRLDRRHFEGRGFWLGPVFPYYPPVYSPTKWLLATVLLSELRRVLPERDELPGAVGDGTG